jgi:hypothetical protein
MMLVVKMLITLKYEFFLICVHKFSTRALALDKTIIIARAVTYLTINNGGLSDFFPVPKVFREIRGCFFEPTDYDEKTECYVGENVF